MENRTNHPILDTTRKLPLHRLLTPLKRKRSHSQSHSRHYRTSLSLYQTPISPYPLPTLPNVNKDVYEPNTLQNFESLPTISRHHQSLYTFQSHAPRHLHGLLISKLCRYKLTILQTPQPPSKRRHPKPPIHESTQTERSTNMEHHQQLSKVCPQNLSQRLLDLSTPDQNHYSVPTEEITT